MGIVYLTKLKNKPRKGIGRAMSRVGKKTKKGGWSHITQKGAAGENYVHNEGVSGNGKFRNSYYVKAYELARGGLGLRGVADALGVSQMTVKNWMARDPDFAACVNQGRFPDTEAGAKQSYIDYVYRRLPPHLVPLWKRLNKFDKIRDGGRKLAHLLGRQTDDVKKWLFVHALVMNHYNVSLACRKVNVPYRQVATWRSDMKFAELMEHVHQMQKDFGEGALMKLIAQGDSSAIQFFNKTKNRDRGYDPRVTVEHTGGVKHTLSLEKVLDRLPMDKRLALLDAMDEAGREVLAIPGPADGLPAELILDKEPEDE